ncbi:cation:proton antiporter regulatory subunit [Nocardia sp. BMG51109]|uniref:cation:proton antiporter regulatory subunit n=1 Tax=Nocardia sp. BMG51109 TaxID=1056816 RepID=UPI0004677ACD|nr:TrkA C-terminal domain-containing protein [Nocardia sp. BMG51109]
MNVDVTALPGIGVRKDFEVRSGRRVGVVAHRDGGLDLILSKQEDQDACAAQVPLTTDEAAALANLLGAPQLVEKLNADHRDMPGIVTRQLPVGEQSPYEGRMLGETRMRTRTKASIVAAMRAGQVHPSPGPDFVLSAGDLLVVVGTPDGLDASLAILTDG